MRLFRYLMALALMLVTTASCRAQGSPSQSVDTSDVVFRWDEAELIDQWQVNSRAAFLRAVSVISAKSNEANSLRIALGRQDSAIATCRATLDLYMARDIAQGNDLDKQRKKIQRLQPWATVGKITAAGAVLYLVGAILHH